LTSARLPLPLPEQAAADHSRRLTEAIADEIAQTGGWMDFPRFMWLALYAPGLGYYAAGSAKLGSAGDFVTAPELSPLFSRMLARQVAQVLADTGGDVLELGPGSGRMAADILNALAQMDRLPGRYLLLEVSADLRERQGHTLHALQERLRERVVWIERLPDELTGVVLANEVLDALPVSIVAWRDGELYERGVACRQDAFEWQDRPLRSGRLFEEALRIGASQPAVGHAALYVSEIGLEARDLTRTLASMLRRGALLLIDYGFGEPEFYHPQRDRGTLMCHYRHRAHDDPFLWPGLQDITAHVNFSTLARAGVEQEMSVLGYTTQANFLVNLGIAQALAAVPADDAATYARTVAPVQRLLSPAEMGELFKVLALGRDVTVPLSGFARGDLSRLL
jgi:SAM-dependent MidA family methyltransferase